MKLTQAALIALVIGAGALLPLQALVNARLGVKLGSPFWASATQNLVGSAAMLLVIALFIRAPAPSPAQFGATPLWAWAGGLMGMVYVISAMLAASQLGAARAMAGVVVGQLVCSLLLDHFGVLHERRPVNLTALAGVVLLIAGAFLILRRD